MIRLGIIVVLIIVGWAIMWCLKKYVIQPRQHQRHMKQLLAEHKELDQQLFEIRRNESHVFQNNREDSK